MDISKVTAGILAGGRHTRMGVDKLLLDYEGQTFLERIYDACDIFSERLVSVADKEKYERFSYPFVEDEIQGYGPLEGMYQLMTHTEKDYVFVLAADLPRINREFLRVMTDRLRDEDGLVLTTEDGLHPLCAIYSKKMLPEIARMREEGLRKPRSLFERFNMGYVSAKDLGYTDEIVQNVNTPEEYKMLIAEESR